MTGSSPARRRSQAFESPRSVISEILGEDRNSEARHKLMLALARRDHERVREEAQQAYDEHLLLEEGQRLMEERKREEERIRREEQLARERAEISALRARKIELPPSPPDRGSREELEAQPINVSLLGKTQPAAPSPFPSTLTVDWSAAEQLPVPLTKKLVNTTLAGSNQPNNPATDFPDITVPRSQIEEPSRKPLVQEPDRLLIIHKNLKELRKFMHEQAKTNQALRSRMGDMRREIRKCVGQLTPGVRSNRQQLSKLLELLREALQNQVQSLPVDPNNYISKPRDPVDGEKNEPQISSLLLYLLNLLAKNAISQYINEASARPETADPVGVCIASIFSEPDFMWRGGSLIDIIIAKFRVVCPVLFGYRGSEKTEQGRQRLGWWKDGGQWIPEQQHMDRMTGLGAGFASISLRRFATSKKTNPYPPTHYWTAMAQILNTPPTEVSDTQCVVLKAMICHFEDKFLLAYGTAGREALRMGLIEFPKRLANKTAAVSSLEVLAKVLKRDAGLDLLG